MISPSMIHQDVDGVINPATQDQLRTWVDALRSRVYQQGLFSLRREDGDNTFFCCLGVAKEVLPEIVPEGFDEVGLSTLVVLKGDEAKEIVEHHRYFLDKRTQSQLTQMNDIYDNTFDEIANWIEDNLIEKGAAS